MIALDTNVLVRFLTQDDAKQAAAAQALISSLTEDAPGFVTREVLLELVWVLEGAYDYARTEIASALDGLLAAPELTIEAADDVAAAVAFYREAGLDFADLLIAAAGRRVGALRLATFDKKAARIEGAMLLGA